MNEAAQLRELRHLVAHLEEPTDNAGPIISWASPVIAFGRLADCSVATLGLNPSNREFVDPSDRELDGDQRRFHTLKSLGLRRWFDADDTHLELIRVSSERYFDNRPYDGWFRPLNAVISKVGVSYYDATRRACHLDLVPFATSKKWGELAPSQRETLLALGRGTLARVLRSSSVRVLVLNGRSVIREFERLAGVTLEQTHMPSWALPNRRGGVQGYAFNAYVSSVGEESLGRRVLVLGYNHNIQSSFGVTRSVVTSISNWVARRAGEVMS
jgi:hypothetical protein